MPSQSLTAQALSVLTLPLKVDLKHVHLTDEQFYQLCLSNPDLKIERTPTGDLVVMPSLAETA